MNKKSRLKSSLDYDAVYGKGIYCYIDNNKFLRKFAKTKLRRSLRREGKEYIRERFYDA